MALSNSKALIGHIRISLKCQQSQAALLQSKKKNQEVSVENPFDRSLLYFKELTSASEKLPTSSGLSPPPCKKVLQLSCPVATTVIFFAGARCHPSTWTGLVADTTETGLSGASEDRMRCRKAGEADEGWEEVLGVQAARRSDTKVRGGVLS